MPSGKQTTPTPPKTLPAEDWDRQFAAGEWDYLDGLDELAHHSIIAGYITRCAEVDSASILDVGCGEGVLQKLLFRYRDYLGIDLSSVALSKASTRENETTRFQAADAETFVPPRRFDVIVFNECLYYFAMPIETLTRYAGYLSPTGFIIVSMYAGAHHSELWLGIANRFHIADKVHVTNSHYTAWDIALLRNSV